MKKMFVCMIIILVCVCLMRMALRKYYFFCTDNVYSLEMIELNLDFFYGDKEFSYVDKEMNVIKEDNGLYRFEYIATLTDGEICFEVVENMCDTKRMGGHLYREDYSDARDNYLRKKFEKEGIDIKAYEIDFREAVANNEPDCKFYISRNEEDNAKVELISTIMREGIDEGVLDFWFQVYTDDGEEIIDSYRLMELYKEEQIDESDLQQFIKEKLELT